MFSAANETDAENDILFLAETATKTKVGDHFQPKPKTKTNIFSYMPEYMNIYSQR